MDRRFVLMVRDELGNDKRAEGTEFLEKTFTFPEFDEEDEAMFNAYIAWRDSIESKGQQEWREHYGDECTVFLEEDWGYKYSHMSLAALEALGSML